MPDRAGVYDVRVSVRGTPPGPRSGLGARDAAATGASNDTATATDQPDILPAGVRLDTLAEDGSVRLDGQPVPGPAYCVPPGHPFRCTRINYVVLDRKTLERTASGSVDANVAGMQSLGAIIDGYSGSLDHLVVLNWVGFAGSAELHPDINALLQADLNGLDNLLHKIGGQPLTAARRDLITNNPFDPQYSQGSAVGVAGAPAGSGFVTVGYSHDCAPGCGPIGLRGGLSGSLRQNALGSYDFVFTDAVDFDTDTNQTRTDFSPAELTIKLGEKTYTNPNPGGGVSGFHVLLLNAKTLEPLPIGSSRTVVTTNAADGAEQPEEVKNLTSLLADGADQAERPLVILQAFGAPHGNDINWDNAAKQIERLGGTRQVFNALNAVDPRPLNGEDAKRHGPYAFIGRMGSIAPLAEASYSLNGEPGRLRGLLMRAHDGGYEPMIAGPPNSEGQSPVNTELVHIADQAPQPFPVFKDANGQTIDAASAQAVQQFLGATNLCPDPGVCDFRRSYYQSYSENWASVQDDLTFAVTHKCGETSHAGFTKAQCEGIASQLRDEVSMIAKVTYYFGPNGLQRPFGAAGAAALANLSSISNDIRESVEPPPADKTTSGVLDVLSEVLHIGGALAGGAEEKAVEVVAETLSGAFGLGAYFTEADGEQELIGPRITTEASKLGVELNDRYLEAGNNLEELGRLIVSDYGKLTAVARKINAPPAQGKFDWRIDNVSVASDALNEAAKRTIYERLVPLAYPVMYDLGERISNARDWYCDSGPNPLDVYNKRLFNEQPDGAQFVGRFPNPDPRYPWNPIIAVAQEHAVGNNAGARIRGIPASITDELFNSPTDTDHKGLGLDKLEFFSPRNGFRYFPAQPGTPALVDERGVTLDRLVEFPYNTSDFPDARILCGDIPDPPGNSG